LAFLLVICVSMYGLFLPVSIQHSRLGLRDIAISRNRLAVIISSHARLLPKITSVSSHSFLFKGEASSPQLHHRPSSSYTVGCNCISPSVFGWSFPHYLADQDLNIATSPSSFSVCIHYQLPRIGLSKYSLYLTECHLITVFYTVTVVVSIFICYRYRHCRYQLTQLGQWKCVPVFELPPSPVIIRCRIVDPTRHHQ